MQVQSGFKSSEFITTLTALVTYVLVTFNIVPTDKLGEMGELITQAVTGIVAIIALVSYHLSRTEVKKSAIESQKNLG